MRPRPLLAVVVIIIFHTSEASQIFNKYFFLESHLDLGLFTQIYQASLREVIVLCFMQCFQASVVYHQEYLHILPKSVYVYIFGGQNGYKSCSGLIFSNENIQGFSNMTQEQSTHFSFPISIPSILIFLVKQF